MAWLGLAGTSQARLYSTMARLGLARALCARALSEGRMMRRDIIIAPLPAKRSGNLRGDVIQANRVPIRLSPEVLVYKYIDSCIRKYKAGGQGKMRQVSFF
jgi:hypothetical protein